MDHIYAILWHYEAVPEGSFAVPIAEAHATLEVLVSPVSASERVRRVKNDSPLFSDGTLSFLGLKELPSEAIPGVYASEMAERYHGEVESTDLFSAKVNFVGEENISNAVRMVHDEGFVLE